MSTTATLLHQNSLTSAIFPCPLGDTGSSVSLIQGTQVSQLPNLFFWFILMGFVLLAGGKIASLGVSMIKDIKVEIKEPISAPPETKST